jgi:hypothetical protein
MHWVARSGDTTQFDLLVATLALIPTGTAYFSAATLGFYLLAAKSCRAVCDSASACYARPICLLSDSLIRLPHRLCVSQNGCSLQPELALADGIKPDLRLRWRSKFPKANPATQSPRAEI